ncbi:hypothetical protein [Neorhizobium sp. LjRoot104]
MKDWKDGNGNPSMPVVAADLPPISTMALHRLKALIESQGMI